jgi:hypothetical protein
MNLTIENVTEAFKRKSYMLNNGIYQLNIFGVRATAPATNKFDDIVGVLYKDYGGIPNLTAYTATTDPGFYYLENPANINGTAILIPGQYPNSHKIGMHQGKYKALVQNTPLRVWRDRNKDHVYDHDPATIETGMFGINIHHAGEHSTEVNNWSAACQVLAIMSEFNALMDLVDVQVWNHWGEVFTYTLFDESDIV